MFGDLNTIIGVLVGFCLGAISCYVVMLWYPKTIIKKHVVIREDKNQYKNPDGSEGNHNEIEQHRHENKPINLVKNTTDSYENKSSINLVENVGSPFENKPINLVKNTTENIKEKNENTIINAVNDIKKETDTKQIMNEKKNIYGKTVADLNTEYVDKKNIMNIDIEKTQIKKSEDRLYTLKDETVK